jgi:hypothetical protein
LSRDIPAAVAECRRLALAHVPAAIDRLASLLDSKDERIIAAAATALMDRAGVAPRAWEGERLEIVATVDVDALRASLAARVAGLVVAREAVIELGAHAPTTEGGNAGADCLALPPQSRGQ